MQDSTKGVFRQGFIFGVGLIIPLVFGYIGYNFISYKILETLNGNSSFNDSYEIKEEDHIKSIEIQHFHDTREGDFVMVIGSIKNTGTKKASSIQVEAEFFNAKGEFVYEQTEYVSKTLLPNEVENFLIKCGCTNRKIPEYSTVTVRVVGASSY